MRWADSKMGFALLLFSVGLVGFILGVLITSAANESGDSTEVALPSVKPTTVLPTAAPTPTRAAPTATPTKVPTATVEAEVPEAVIRWREWFQVHNPNLIAIQEAITEVGKDRVIDEAEHKQFCFIYPQWEKQLVAMTDYSVEYREIDPETVQANQAYFDAREEAVRRVQAVVAEVELTCP